MDRRARPILARVIKDLRRVENIFLQSGHDVLASQAESNRLDLEEMHELYRDPPRQDHHLLRGVSRLLLDPRPSTSQRQ